VNIFVSSLRIRETTGPQRWWVRSDRRRTGESAIILKSSSKREAILQY